MSGCGQGHEPQRTALAQVASANSKQKWNTDQEGIYNLKLIVNGLGLIVNGLGD